MRSRRSRILVILLSSVLVGACASEGTDPQTGGAADSADPSLTTAAALRNVVAAARTARADTGSSYAGLGPKALARVWDGVCYQAGDSQAGMCRDGAILVQIASTTSRFGAAALDDSSRCLWITDGPNGTNYGAGFPCTGVGAMRAVGRRFPIGTGQ